MINGALTAISTGLFALAFKYSVSNEKHPYLIYAALGAPLSFISLYYNIYSVEEKILSQQKSKSTSVAKTRTKLKHSESSTTNQEDAQAYDDEDEPAELISKITSSDSLLGKSYVHLSDESGISTPNSTTSHPSTPKLEPRQQEQEQPTPADDDVELEVEQEVENILIKKQVVQNLKKIESGYTIASYVSGISFVIASIGLIGDYYYF